MIRYPISEIELRQRIEQHKKGWLDRADKALVKVRKTKGKRKFPPLWSEIKDVYIVLQHSKCVFCEKRLEGLPLGRVEQDVEHFRPKASVKVWKVSRVLLQAGVKAVPTSKIKEEPGYALLAYHPLNYAMACKTCNSALKRNYFPIGDRRHSDRDDPASLASEKAYLIYPIGSIDDDPETLIEFHGLSPRAKHGSGFKRLRALVSIDFFKLDKGKNRNTLMRGRAELVEKLYFALMLRAKTKDAAERARYGQVIARLQREDEEHANCLRSFARLHQQDSIEAEKMYAVVKTFLETISV